MQRKNIYEGNKNKLIMLFPSILVMFIALALGSYAIDCGFQTPANNGVLGNNANITVSFSNPGTTDDTISIIINASSSLTANSSARTILIANVSNNTGVGMTSQINFTLGNNDVVILEPSNNYVLVASVENSTVRATCNSTRTGITIDRANIPTAPATLTPTGTVTSGDQSFSATVNGANTTSCTLRFDGKNPGSAIYGMTHSENTCTLTINGMAENIYTYYVVASDETNTTESSRVTLTFESNSGGLGGGIVSGGAIVQPKKLSVIALPETKIPTTTADLKSELAPMEVTKTGIGVLGGMAIGAYLGTIALPGIGTVSGLLVGGVIGGIGGFII